MTRRAAAIWAALAAAGAAALALRFAQAAAVAGHGTVLPLDDPYIYFVYARNTAAGHFLAYNPGDGPSSGATSLLWTLLLVPGFWLGVRGAGAVPLALGLGAACVATYLVAFALCCRRAGAGPWGAALAAASTALYSRFAWGAYSGLEVPLTAAAVAVFALALLTDAGPVAPIVGALLTAVRPDVGLAAIPAVLLWASERRETRRAWALLPVAAAAAWAVCWRIATGEPAVNGALVKTRFFAPGLAVWSLWAHLPRDVLAEVRSLLTVHGHANAWGFVLIAAAVPALGLRAGRALWAFAAAGLVLEALAFGGGVAGIQFGRYDLPFLAAVELAAAVGLAAAARGLRLPLWPLACAAVVLSAPTLRVALADYARDSGEIRGQQIAAAAYIRTSLPADAVVMLNDAGAMNYLGGRYTLDIEGLGTNGFALPTRAGTGSTYEHLLDVLAARPQLAERPLFFVVYPAWFPGIEAAFGACPAQFSVPHPTILGGPTAVLCAADLPAEPDPGLRVADLDQDRAFAYSAQTQGGTWLLRLPDAAGQPRIGSGRAVQGAEAFTVPAEPGRPLVLTALTTELGNVPVDVRAAGQDLGVWDWPAAPGRWETLTFVIPAGAVQGRSVRIALDGPGRLTSVYRWAEG